MVSIILFLNLDFRNVVYKQYYYEIDLKKKYEIYISYVFYV